MLCQRFSQFCSLLSERNLVAVIFLLTYIRSVSISTPIGQKSSAINRRFLNVCLPLLAIKLFRRFILTKKQIWKPQWTSSSYGPICNSGFHASAPVGYLKPRSGRCNSETRGAITSQKRPASSFLQLGGSQKITGTKGQTLEHQWKESQGVQAYFGTYVHNFLNFAIL
jgi:hypothetical protein